MFIISIIGGDEVKYVCILAMIPMLLLGGCSKKETNDDMKKYQKNKRYEEKTLVPENYETQETKAPDNKEERVMIAQAQTTLYDKSENRMNNIRLASSAINGYVIQPYGMFSFNEAVGERTEAKGYKKAPVLFHKEKEYDYGGGVCQVSTTLCMAARSGGLEIKERHSHEKNVDYAQSGEDAAVNYDSLDLKFVNNTDNEVTIYAGVYDEFIVIQLYG